LCCQDFQTFTLLRQKSVISLPCLRKETSFNDNVSFSLAYRINQFFFTELDFLEKKNWYGTATVNWLIANLRPHLRASVSQRHPVQEAVVKLYTLFKSQDHDNYTLSDINRAKKGNNPPVCPLLCFCVKLP